MKLESLLLERSENGVYWLRINRPAVLNALNTQVLRELSHVLDELYSDANLRVLVVTGSGKAFVAGADIEEMSTMSPIEGEHFAHLGVSVFRRLEQLPVPVIAAVNGYALGGGCELALSCDIRIASEKAVFGQPEVGLGITPGFGGTQRLPRVVGYGIAMELLLSARNVRSDEALRIGLVNSVVPSEELESTCITLATKIVDRGPLAVRLAKQAVQRGMQVDVDTALSIENSLFGLCFSSADQKEGMAAFLEKRKANFTGK